ncbi:hypothetical protein ACEV6G_08100 [Enterobacter ludwigii]|uniref:hypothetical protein n=1 Tax=Enterobacter ludwigii TaxID=299767 RepID=UPI003BEEE547
MSTITKEWLQQTIGEYEANRDELPFGLDTNSAIELQAFKLALASLEAEAVSEFYHEARWGWYEISEGDKVPERARIPLYRVAPAPVSLPDELTRDQYKRRFMEDDDFDDTFRGGWNAAIARFKEMNKCL